MLPIFNFKVHVKNKDYIIPDGTDLIRYHLYDIRNSDNNHLSFPISRILDSLTNNIKDNIIYDHTFVFDKIFPDFKENLLKFAKDIYIDSLYSDKEAQQNFDSYLLKYDHTNKQ